MFHRPVLNGGIECGSAHGRTVVAQSGTCQGAIELLPHAATAGIACEFSGRPGVAQEIQAVHVRVEECVSVICGRKHNFSNEA
jgi:hypothetical protein